MGKILDISAKDLRQLLRDRKTFLFSLVLPVLFTLMFGVAFGGFGGGEDTRLPVGLLDLDGSALSRELRHMLDGSKVVRLVVDTTQTPAGLEALVSSGDLAAAVIVPPGYGHALQAGHPSRLELVADTGTSAGTSVENELLAGVIHLENAVRVAAALEDLAGEPFQYHYAQALGAWQDPPVQVQSQASTAIVTSNSGREALAHTSPGMMLQFAIAGLVVSAQILVTERKSRCLPRLLTSMVGREQILLGHFLAIFLQVLLQFMLLIAFGQFLLGVAYLRAPLATFLVAASAAACMGALGLLIGVLARDEEQAAAMAIVPMFVLTGLGGGWVPLEVVGPTFQKIGHLSPVAWGMDGFKNVVIRGLGVEAVLLPAAVLLCFALGAFGLAAWRFRHLEMA